MANYQAFHCLETGYSHRNDCCQDYSGHFESEHVKIAVISDGHGDKSCFRSEVGSKTAVEVAIAQMKGFAAGIRKMGWQQRLLEPGHQETLMRQLKRAIVAAWDTAVRAHIQENPLTEADFQRQTRYTDSYRRGEHLTHIYGCTLIAAMIIEDILLVLHIGDGRCVVLHADGTADQPVPWDALCVGNVTTSLCHEDAADRCRHFVLDLKTDPILGCFVTSDGIEDSFSDLPDQNGLCAYFCDVAARLSAMGIPALEEEMHRELPYISQYGSQDDTSFGALVNLEAIKPLEGPLGLVFEMYRCRLEAETVHRKLNSMQRKMDILKENVNTAQRRATQAEEDCLRAGQELQDAEQDYQEKQRRFPERLAALIQEAREQITAKLEGLLRRAEQALADCRDRNETSLRNREDAQARLAQATKALEDYSRTRQTYVDQYAAAMEKLDALKEKARRLYAGLPEEAPAAEKPAAEEPVVEAPIAEEPIAEAPIAEEPAAEEPIAEEPVVEEPVDEAPAAEDPIVSAPAVNDPDAEDDWESPRAALPKEDEDLL